MVKRPHFLTSSHPKTLLLAVHSPHNNVRNIQGYFEEFVHLVQSNGIKFDTIKEVKLRTIDTTSFFTKGKLEELVEICREGHFEEVIISEALSIQQERTLSSLFHCTIFDRTNLILEIFEKRASSAEGKLQVHIARLQYDKSRLAGKGIHFSQQGGSIGTRGPGETQKESETRHIEHLMRKLRKDLLRIAQSRATQRKRRLQNKVPLICLIGYTNAGKSSILNALTHSDVLVENQLFSTLDTTTRELYIGDVKIGLISDTVGFIQKLPPQLIEAFKSTLHELSYAHLLLHVVDISDPNWRSHITIVQNLLTKLKLSNPTVYVFNKADKLTPEAYAEVVKHLPIDHPVIMSSTVSAHSGLLKLKEFLQQWHIEQSAAQVVASDLEPSI